MQMLFEVEKTPRPLEMPVFSYILGPINVGALEQLISVIALGFHKRQAKTGSCVLGSRIPTTLGPVMLSRKVRGGRGSEQGQNCRKHSPCSKVGRRVCRLFLRSLGLPSSCFWDGGKRGRCCIFFGVLLLLINDPSSQSSRGIRTQVDSDKASRPFPNSSYLQTKEIMSQTEMMLTLGLFRLLFFFFFFSAAL